mmetsp:Transcript_61085/g.73473  ORF Transcript_61085/g.73473 Transcript_61085/m.73473 type:complete len:877 (+) Transcript_61085:199-2829(+)
MPLVGYLLTFCIPLLIKVGNDFETRSPSNRLQGFTDAHKFNDVNPFLRNFVVVENFCHYILRKCEGDTLIGPSENCEGDIIDPLQAHKGDYVIHSFPAREGDSIIGPLQTLKGDSIIGPLQTREGDFLIGPSQTCESITYSQKIVPIPHDNPASVSSKPPAITDSDPLGNHKNTVSVKPLAITDSHFDDLVTPLNEPTATEDSPSVGSGPPQTFLPEIPQTSSEITPRQENHALSLCLLLQSLASSAVRHLLPRPLANSLAPTKAEFLLSFKSSASFAVNINAPRENEMLTKDLHGELLNIIFSPTLLSLIVKTRWSWFYQFRFHVLPKLPKYSLTRENQSILNSCWFCAFIAPIKQYSLSILSSCWFSAFIAPNYRNRENAQVLHSKIAHICATRLIQNNTRENKRLYVYDKIIIIIIHINNVKKNMMILSIKEEPRAMNSDVFQIRQVFESEGDSKRSISGYLHESEGDLRLLSGVHGLAIILISYYPIGQYSHGRFNTDPQTEVQHKVTLLKFNLDGFHQEINFRFENLSKFLAACQQSNLHSDLLCCSQKNNHRLPWNIYFVMTATHDASNRPFNKFIERNKHEKGAHENIRNKSINDDPRVSKAKNDDNFPVDKSNEVSGVPQINLTQFSAIKSGDALHVDSELHHLSLTQSPKRSSIRPYVCDGEKDSCIFPQGILISLSRVQNEPTCVNDNHLLVQNSQEVNLIHQNSNRHSNCRDDPNAKVPLNSCTAISLCSDISFLMPEKRPILYRSLSKIEHQGDAKIDRDARNAVDGQQFIFKPRCSLLKIQTAKTGIVALLLWLLKFLESIEKMLLIFLFIKNKTRLRKVHIPNLTRKCNNISIPVYREYVQWKNIMLIFQIRMKNYFEFLKV